MHNVPHCNSPRLFPVIALGLLAAVCVPAAITIGTVLPPGSAGQSYSLTLAPTGGTSPYYNSVSSGSLPSGLTLTSAGILSGTPQSAGLYSFSVQSTDSLNLTGLSNLTLRVTSGTGLQITNVMAEGTVGTAYDTSLRAQGGTASYSFDLVMGGGSIPPGLTITSVGRVSGTPTSAGAYPMIVRVTDAIGNSYQAAMTVRISSTNLSLATTSLSGASAGMPYTQTILATGGTGPYTYVVNSGALAPGLTISNMGTITGTATTVGTYNFSVQATDSTGALTQSNYTLLVGASSPRILANTIPNFAVNTAIMNSLRTQGGTAPYTYTIMSGTLPPGVTLSPAGAVRGTPTSTGSFPLTIRVTDAAGFTSTSEIVLNINTGNFGITTSNLPDGLVNMKYATNLRTSGGTAPFLFLMSTGKLPPGLTLNMDGLLVGTPTASGLYRFVVRAFDGANQVAQIPLMINIETAGQSLSKAGLANGTVGQPYTSTLSVTNGTAPYVFSLVSGTLPSGLTLGQNGNVSGIPTSSGLYIATIKVTDATAASSQTTVAVVISGPGVAFTTLVLPATRQNQSYSTTLQAMSGTSPYTFALASGTLPQGLTLSSAGVLSGVVGGTSAAPFTIRVTDGSGASSQVTYFFDINASNITMVGATPGAGQEGRAYTYTFTTAGGTGATTYSLESGTLPPGLTLSPNGTLSGTPSAAGAYVIRLKATDASGAVSSFSYVLVINRMGLAFAANQVSDVVVGTPYSATVSGTGGTGPYTFTLADGTLPAGLTLASNGVLAGMATAPGSFPVALRITDSTGATATMALTITVKMADAITIGSSLPSGTAGTAYAFLLTATGGQAPYTFNLNTGSSLPSGLSLSNSGLLSGTPSNNGVSTFTVMVKDGSGATGVQALTLTTASTNLNMSATTLPNGTIGAAYNFTASPSGGTAPYMLTLVGGTLPPGISMSPSGVFSGTATSVGSFPIILRLADSTGVQIQKAYTMVITGTSGLVFTTTSVPMATFGQSYSTTLQASGGMAPYTYSVASGNLPGNLSLAMNGTISGTMSGTGGVTIGGSNMMAGQFPVSFRVTDANGATATTTLVFVTN